MAEFRLDGVSKRFGAVQALRDLTLHAADGEFVVLLGPTGAGKTTTLRLLAGLERADTGHVTIGGADVTSLSPAGRDVTFVFQQYSLYPHLTVRDNLAFPLRSPARRWDAARIDAKVREVAALLRIDDKLDNKATRLSGGQMQRVAIGRALVRAPQVALMDEPLSSLDAKLRGELRVELKRIQRELGTTILYVTHDQTEAMTLATRIGVLDQGRLVQVGTPRDIYERPASVYVATRLGSPAINLLPRALLPRLAAPEATVTIGARTEHLRVRRAAGGAGIGRVRWIEHLGDANHLHLRVADGGDEHDLVILTDPGAGLVVGDAVEVDFVAPLFFGADGRRIEA
ncbi:MAG: ABC transporter ATP-binding protein [Pseudomonadota bacterium]|jgi:multiple sugar transport system ATP-binding protein